MKGESNSAIKISKVLLGNFITKLTFIGVYFHKFGEGLLYKDMVKTKAAKSQKVLPPWVTTHESWKFGVLCRIFR